jgi:mannose-6-phosphate isomerase
LLLLTGYQKSDPWGSTTAVQELLGHSASASPISEVWFGSHADGPTSTGTTSLAEVITQDPKLALGKGVTYSFGSQLPFLAKIIAPAQALSLQVHPTKEIAREGYLREEALGIPRNSPMRTYKDMNHKPEMIYALTDYEALIGFRVPRKARELLEGLDGQIAEFLRRRLQLSTVRGGLRSLIAWLFDPDTTLTASAIDEFASACTHRLEAGNSPSARTDQLIKKLALQYPGDPGVVVAFLMNPVSLRPGEVAYIPPRQIHSYQSGLGIEIMATSDNVVRAGLTHKHVDATQLVEIAEFSALPPIRLAPEHPTPTTDRFLAPVQEFELSVTTLGARKAGAAVVVPGEGPRIIIGTDGELELSVSDTSHADLFGPGVVAIRSGEAVFIAATERSLTAHGHGQIVQCAVP